MGKQKPKVLDFQSYRIPKSFKLKIASIQLDGDTVQLYNWFKTYHGVPTWDRFNEGFLVCFGLSNMRILISTCQNLLDLYNLGVLKLIRVTIKSSLQLE